MVWQLGILGRCFHRDDRNRERSAGLESEQLDQVWRGGRLASWLATAPLLLTGRLWPTAVCGVSQNIPFEWPVSGKAASPDLFSVYAGY